MDPIKIKADDRVTIVGKTGSGKSYLARYLLWNVPRLVVCDPKGMMKPEEWRLENYTKGRFRRLQQGKNARLRVPPLATEDEWEEYFDEFLKLRNTTIYIDELYGVGPSENSAGLRGLYTRGRERGISVWSATQRPTWIPLFALSEAGWIINFKLTLDQDRKRMAEIIGPAGYINRPNFAFGLYEDQTGKVREFPKLDVKGIDTK